MRAIVSLGSNLGDREEYIRKALAELSRMPSTSLVAESPIVETEGVDVPPEYAELKFLNAVAIFETSLDPFEFSRLMHGIEEKLGRKRTVKNGPRTIDIDLVDFGGLEIATPDLVLPHPRAAEREFVTKPLAELGVSPAWMRQPRTRRPVVHSPNVLRPASAKPSSR